MRSIAITTGQDALPFLIARQRQRQRQHQHQRQHQTDIRDSFAFDGESKMKDTTYHHIRRGASTVLDVRILGVFPFTDYLTLPSTSLLLLARGRAFFSNMEMKAFFSSCLGVRHSVTLTPIASSVQALVVQSGDRPPKDPRYSWFQTFRRPWIFLLSLSRSFMSIQILVAFAFSCLKAMQDQAFEEG